MSITDIRWKQRFSNYKKAFAQLERFIEKTNLNELEKLGLIKAFEYTYELSWKTLQDLLKEKGYLNILGPKPVIQQSFQNGYISEGNRWMLMHQSRNLTSHTYDEETASEIVESIRNDYYYLFEDLLKKLKKEEVRERNQKRIQVFRKMKSNKLHQLYPKIHMLMKSSCLVPEQMANITKAQTLILH